MADNVPITPGSGADIATDEIGGLHYQRTKVGFGVDGSYGDVSDANPMPVSDGSSQNLLNRILSVLASPLGYDKSLQRQRSTAVIESGTVTTVGAINNINNIAAIDGYSARMTVLDQNRSAWAQCVRARIT